VLPSIVTTASPNRRFADIGGLRKQAAQVGADAVIVTDAKNTGMFNAPNASGKAIKWTKSEAVQQ
jgi:hypothetical protein